jgi:hypothetical protein
MGTKKEVKTKVEVAERALLARINRALAGIGERIIRSRPIRGKLFRGKPVYPEVGHYYRVSGKARAVVARDVDLGAAARELGLLKSWEVYSPPELTAEA